MKVIVTGGAGFIGSNLALALDKDHDVTVVDDFSNADFRNLVGFKGRVLAYDIREVEWEECRQIDLIFHQAALTDTRETDQRKVLDVNVNSFRRMLQYSRKTKVPIIYASSAAVYGQGQSPMKEEQPLSPLNIYGFSKSIMDNMASRFWREAPDVPLVGLRYFNVFGPRESHKKQFASMICQLSEQMKQGRRPRVFKKGEQTRDHIYVKDVVAANLLLMEKLRSGIYNVGTGAMTSFNDIISYLNKALGTQFEPEYFDNPYPFFQKQTCADISKLRELGFQPRFSVEQGIRDYFK